MNKAEKDPLQMLTALDAAPSRPLTGFEARQKEDLLRTVLTETVSAPQPTSRARRRRPLLLMAAGAVAATAAIVTVATVPSGTTSATAVGSGGPLSSIELASWTGTPTHPTSTAPSATAAEKWCLQALDKDPANKDVSYSNLDVRGTVTSVVVTDGSTISYCITGKKGDGMAEVIDPVKKLSDDAVKVGSAGARGKGSTGVNYMEGSVGSDVKSVTFHDSGRTVNATIEKGRFVAWWPAAKPSGAVSGKVVLTLQDGSTRTVSGNSLFETK
ncbi:hypothetical protein [Streptomyces sp. NBC_01497]|uniref:hypothetical protein n=1 Tax=Streptomyces sp. NBC_01497 TaxID=2903885 RepID=UPI002E30E556|nr:hypothetical protein [Streptomyces sp. NBC_01497]